MSPRASAGHTITLTGTTAPAPDSRTNAIRVPSGDHAGEASRMHSSGPQFVNAAGSEPSAFIVQIWSACPETERT
jgi:hypothetical protein